jgi:hypothetical protein
MAGALIMKDEELGNKCIFNNLTGAILDQWIAFFSAENKNIAFKNAKTL